MAFEIYKPGQGKYTRIVTFVAVVCLGIIGAYQLSGSLSVYLPEKIAGASVKIYLQYGIPTVLVGVLALVMFHIVNRMRPADFLIATEGEMKKVAWSSRKEIIGSTKVVIVTSFIIAALLFGVDWLFVVLFRKIGLIQL
ncbi:MAG: preprotein translocase subunit SecE [Planctomycetaceae bacterium]|nr:preprotein translocase subunit SecE [Planctomycetaceae bacterium]